MQFSNYIYDNKRGVICLFTRYVYVDRKLVFEV